MRRCPMCGEASSGPGCCLASLKAELWRLESLKDGLRDAFNRRQTPYLQGRLFKVAEDIEGVRWMIREFETVPEAPERAGGYASA